MDMNESPCSVSSISNLFHNTNTIHKNHGFLAFFGLVMPTYPTTSIGLTPGMTWRTTLTMSLLNCLSLAAAASSASSGGALAAASSAALTAPSKVTIAFALANLSTARRRSVSWPDRNFAFMSMPLTLASVSSGWSGLLSPFGELNEPGSIRALAVEVREVSWRFSSSSSTVRSNLCGWKFD